MLGQELVADVILDGEPVGWFAPSYKLLTETWRDIRTMLQPIISAQNVAEKRLEFITDGSLDMWSMDNPDAGRGRKYARVIIDEAALVKELMHSWSASIRPTLTDLVGDAWFLSTPKGRNSFWQMWQMGQDEAQPDWASWQMPTVANPWMDPAEVEAAKRMLPERIYAQEYLAQFLDDAGGVFHRVMDCATAVELDGPEEDRQYVAGVDVADKEDWTVATVMDVAAQRMVYMDRFQRVGYTALEDRLHALYERWGLDSMIIEANSIGQPVIDHLRQRGMFVIPFHTGPATKMPLIQTLQSAFEHGDIEILNDPVLIGELQAYESTETLSGYRYSAPEGLHDDCVMSLAIGWQGIATQSGVRMAW